MTPIENNRTDKESLERVHRLLEELKKIHEDLRDSNRDNNTINLNSLDFLLRLHELLDESNLANLDNLETTPKPELVHIPLNLTVINKVDK